MAPTEDASSSNSEIRARAVAQLQRATSLSRLQKGRRPSPSPANSSGFSSQNASDDESWDSTSRRLLDPRNGSKSGGSSFEQLSTPSRPYPPSSFDPTLIQASPYTPLDLSAYNRTPDQRSHAPEASMPRGTSPVLAGRSTPSPLPSLGELRQLQRANSAAGRLVAMKKLMGEDPPSPQSLQRAGSLNSPEVMMSPSKRRRERAAESDSDIPIPSAPALSRSYTVDNGSGQERRSVIGRKMMQRLGNRMAKGDTTLDESIPVVPQDQLLTSSWVGSGDTSTNGHYSTLPQIVGGDGEVSDGNITHLLRADDGQEVTMPAKFPSSIHLDSPLDPFLQPRSPAIDPSSSLGMVPSSPARAASRMTDVSGDEAFEYEGHLRRSMSEKERKLKSGKESMEPPSETSEEILFTPRPEDVDKIPDLPAGLTATASGPSPYDSIPPNQNASDSAPPLVPFNTSQQQLSGHTQSLSGSSTNSGSFDPMSKIPFMLASGFSPESSGRTRQFGNRIGRDESMASFPRAVGEGDGTGSIVWGTPGKEATVATSSPLTPSHSAGKPSDSRLVQSPETPERGSTGAMPHRSHTRSGSAFKEMFDNDEPSPATTTPIGLGQHRGDMSWEEVGGLSDREVPVDAMYQKKVDSVVGKLERSIRGTFKRRGSKEEGEGTGISPNEARGSQSSSNLESSGTHSGGPSINPAKVPGRNGSLTSSILSNTPSVVLEPGQASPMPQADSSDPRFQNSKLCPAPGVLPPPLLQQASDSLVTSLQSSRSMSASTSNQSLPPTTSPAYYDLPPRSPSPPSGSSVGKKSWLAEAFFAPTGNNFLQKRRPSLSDMLKRKTSRSEFAGNQANEPQAAHNSVIDAGLRRTEIPHEDYQPAFSTASPMDSATVIPGLENHVPDPNMYRSVTDGGEQNGFSHEGQTPPSNVLEGKSMSSRSQEVMKKLDKILAMAPEDPDRPDVLDDPPRRLVLCSPVLQVVNGHTVKDRFLFLFTDLLVIAKPLSDDESIPELDGHFTVKSVVALEGLKVAPMGGDDKSGTEPASRHPVVGQFINSFLRNPAEAVQFLTERSQLQGDHATIASLLFKTPELDKEQLGLYLARAENIQLLRAFIDRFHFNGVKIHDALRMFLLSLRLPSETSVSEVVLYALAERWQHANRAIVGYDKNVCAELVLAIMQLNDALNPGSGFGSFAFPNQVISPDDFIGAFQSKDSGGLVPSDVLENIFVSIRKERLVQALPRSQSPQLREVLITPARLPTRLTYNVWSERIYISIPRADARFGIKLQGEGLVFDPPYLDFSESTEESFRVMGTSLGARSLLFARTGTNAPLYANLANTKTFIIERSFMRHTFQISFSNHLDIKRKYCFSLDNAEALEIWFKAVSEHAHRTRRAKVALIPRGLIPPPVKVAAEAISLRVLQSSLIADDNEETTAAARPSLGSRTPSQSRSGSQLAFSSSSNSAPRGPAIVRQMTGRRVSVAKIMQTPPPPTSLSPIRSRQGSKTSVNWNLGPTQEDAPEKDPLPAKAQTGKDIVLICRQNSLLPVVMAFLHAGFDNGATSTGDDPNKADHGDRMKRGSGGMHRAMTMM